MDGKNYTYLVGEQYAESGNQTYRDRLKHYTVDKVEKSGKTKSKRYVKKIPTYGNFKSRELIIKYFPEISIDSETLACQKSSREDCISPANTSYSLQDTSKEISSKKCFCVDECDSGSPVESGDKENLFKNIQKQAMIFWHDQKTLSEIPTIRDILTCENAVPCLEDKNEDDITSFVTSEIEAVDKKSKSEYYDNKSKSKSEYYDNKSKSKLSIKSGTEETLENVSSHGNSSSITSHRILTDKIFGKAQRNIETVPVSEINTSENVKRKQKKKKKGVQTLKWKKPIYLRKHCNSKAIKKQLEVKKCYKDLSLSLFSPSDGLNNQDNDMKTISVPVDPISKKLADLDSLFNSIYETIQESTDQEDTFLEQVSPLLQKNFAPNLIHESSESKISSLSDINLLYNYKCDFNNEIKSSKSLVSSFSSTINEKMDPTTNLAQVIYPFSKNTDKIIGSVCDSMFADQTLNRLKKKIKGKFNNSYFGRRFNSVSKKRSNKFSDFFKNMKLIKRKKFKMNQIKNDEMLQSICSDIADDVIIVDLTRKQMKRNETKDEGKSDKSNKAVISFKSKLKFSNKITTGNDIKEVAKEEGLLDSPTKIIESLPEPADSVETKSESQLCETYEYDSGDSASKINLEGTILSPPSKEVYQISLDNGEISSPVSPSSTDIKADIPSRTASNLKVQWRANSQKAKSCSTNSFSRLSYPDKSEGTEVNQIKRFLKKLNNCDKRNPLTKLPTQSEESDCVSCAVFSDFEKYHKKMCSLNSLSDLGSDKTIGNQTQSKKYGKHIVDFVFEKEKKTKKPSFMAVDPNYSFYLVGPDIELEEIIQPFRTALFKRFLKYISERAMNKSMQTCCQVCKQKRSLMYKDLRVFVLEKKFDVTFDIGETRSPIMRTDKAYLITIVGKDYTSIKASYTALLNRIPELGRYICSRKNINNSSLMGDSLEFYKPHNSKTSIRNRPYMNLLDHPRQKDDFNVTEFSREHYLHVPLRKERINRITLKYLAIPELDRLFRQNKRGEFVSQRLVDLENLYDVKFEDISIVLMPKINRCARMIHIKVSYKDHKNLEIVTGLLNNFVKVSGEKI